MISKKELALIVGLTGKNISEVGLMESSMGLVFTFQQTVLLEKVSGNKEIGNYG